MADSDDWESDVKSTIAKIVRSAVLQERLATIRILKDTVVHHSLGKEMIESAIVSISKPKIDFHGERI